MPPTALAKLAPPASAAAAWIDLRHALVARTTPGPAVEVLEVFRPHDRSEPVEGWLAQVADLIGDHQRVLILGAGPLRLALEREYVSRFRRRERIVDVEPSAPMGREALIRRVEELAG